MISHIKDLVHAARTLIKARAFTAVCVASLGLGMGVVIAIMLLMRMLFGTPSGVDDDGLVYSLAAAVAFVVAALAGIPSARRAAAVQPIVAIRAE